MKLLHSFLTGRCPASTVLQDGVKGHNMMKPPCRKAPPFRAGSFTCAVILVFSLILFPCLCRAQPKIPLPSSSCVTCHLDLGGTEAAPVKLMEGSIHLEKEVGCHDCHGGDPKSFNEEKAMSRAKGFIGVPGVREIPGLCARCHSSPVMMRPYHLRTDQLALYKTSPHGILLYQKGDRNAATCISCHGSHDIKSVNDPLSSVYKTNIPKTCARCHSDRKLMDRYKIPSNQYDLYHRSVHGKMLLEKSDLRAPSCADCHGVHGAHPPGYTEIADVCSACHATTADFFKQSPHYVEKTRAQMARCIDCHGSHDVSPPTTDLYAGGAERHCGFCHGPGSEGIQVALILKTDMDNAAASVNNANKAIEQIRDSGLDIDRIEGIYESAWDAWVKAGAVTHTLDVDKVEELTKKADGKSNEVIRSVHQIQKELERRKEGVLFVLVILGLIILIVSIYYSRAKRRWIEERR